MFRLNQIIKSINCLKNKNLLKSRFILSLLFLFSVNALLFGAEDITWTGYTSADWDTATNWSPIGIPNDTSDVVIPYVTRSPVLASSKAIKSLVLEASSSLTVNGSLSTSADISNSGTLNGSGTITVSGLLTNNSKINSSSLDIVTKDLTVATSSNFTSKDLTVSGNSVLKADISVATVILGTDTTNTVTGSGKITATGDFTNNSNQTSTGAISVGGNIINNGTISGSGAVTVGGTFSNTGTVNKTGTVTVSSAFTDSGTWTASGDIILTGTNNQILTLKGGTTYPALQNNKTSGNITITNDSGTSSLASYTDVASTGSVTFSSDITIKAATTMNTSGEVIVDSGKTLTINDGTNQDFTHTGGKTTINGTLVALNVTTGETDIAGTLTATNAVETGALTLTGAGTLTGASLVCGGAATFSGTGSIETTGNQIFNGTVSGTGTSVIKTTSTGELSILKGLTAGSLILASTPSKINLGGTINVGTSALTFNQPVVLTDDTSIDCVGVTFNYPVDSSVSYRDLTITSSGDVMFSGSAQIGNSFPLDELRITATSKDVTFSQIVKTNSNITITADDVNINNTITSSGSISITNSGVLTIDDKDGYDDTTYFDVSGTSFTQSGAGTVEIAGDINATSGTISFAGAITLTGSLKLSATGDITLSSTVDGDTAGTWDLITLSTSGNINFTNALGSTTTIKSVDAKGTVITFDNNIETTGAITTKGTTSVAFSGNVKTSSTGVITTETPSCIINAGDTTVEGSSFTVTGTMKVQKTAATNSVTFSLPVEITDELNVTTGTFTQSSGNTTVGGNFTNNGTFIRNNTPGTLTVGGNFTDNGTWTETTSCEIILNGTGTQNFEPGTATYNKITIDKTTAATQIVNFINDALNAASIVIKANSQNNFTTAVTIGAITDQSDSGTISFLSGGTINSDTTFNTTSLLTINDASSETFNFGSTGNYKNVVHTAGKTVIVGILNASDSTFDEFELTGIMNAANVTTGKTTINGTVNAATTTLGDISKSVTVDGTIATSGNQLYKGSTTFKTTASSTNGNITFNKDVTLSGISTFTANDATNGAITFNSTVSSAFDATFTSTKLTFVDDVTASISTFTVVNTSTSSFNDFKINKLDFTGTSATATATFNATGIVTENLVIPCIVELNNSSSTTSTDGSIQFEKAVTVNGKSTVVSADVTPTNSDKGILFGVDAAVTVGANTLTLDGSTLLKSGFTGTGTVNIDGNLIIHRGSTATVTIACATNVSKNIVLYTGALSVSKDLTSTLDIVLLGAGYNDTDPQTSVAGAYKYANPRPSACNYSETNLPAGQGAVPTSYSGYSGVMTVSGATTIKTSKNLYANGISCTGSGWTLALPRNKNNDTSFSEVYNSTFTGVTVSGTDVSIATEDSKVPKNTSWDTSEFEIKSVESVRDDVIKVTFNRAVRNPTANTFNLNQTYARMTNKAGSYGKFYTDIGCTTELSAGSAVTEVYIKSPNTWNTDATGTSAGSGTDASGDHKKDVIPYLSIPRDAYDASDASKSYGFFVTDLYGKRLKHYADTGTGSKWTTVPDKAGPVLISCKTGQELHDVYSGTEASQHSYDSHNFIEFNFSESVTFGSLGDEIYTATTASPFADYENIQVSDSFGALSTDITTTGTLNFVGLAQIKNGKIYTGKDGSTDKYANALYSSSSSSIKLSVAGYTNGTITGTDGNNYKKWESYIENGVIPTGIVYLPSNSDVNSFIKDKESNSQVKNYKSDISVASTTDGVVYGGWDLKEPVFAPLKMNSEMTGIEAVGGGDGSVLNKIEFHILDNPSSTDDSCYWFTEKGWCTGPVASASLYAANSYSADIFGGSKPFSTGTNKITGGVRYSSLLNQQNAFKYCVGINGTPNRPFTAIEYGADASLFTGATNHRRAVPLTADSLYFSLDLTDTNIHYNQSFTVSYNSSSSYITDLAGNRLRSVQNNTIDRTPPSFNISLSPVSNNEIYVTFVKRLRRSDIIYKGSHISESFETILPYCFEIGTIDNSGTFTANTDLDLIINTNVPCSVVKNKNEDNYTTIKLTLNKNITLDDVKNLYIRVKNAGTVGGNTYEPTSTDPVTGLADCYVTFIQDSLGNYMQYYEAHALSDFAINVAFPEYAYDAEMTVNGESLMDGLYQRGSWAVHNWNEEQYNYGTLPYGDPIDLVSSFSDGNAVLADLNPHLRLYLANSPTDGSVSSRINSDLQEEWRVWMPDVSVNGQNNTFTTFASSNNYNFKFTDSTFMNSTDGTNGLRFSISQSIVDSWKSGDQISYLFGLQTSTGTPVPIVHSPYLDVATLTYNMSPSVSLQYPLLCLRLKNQEDIFSLDLWSFKVKSVINQRGGVTILNNVINPILGEKCVVKITTVIPSKVNVIVMTLDGNVVTYLNRTYLGQGDHYFTWNGTNNSGNFVARGMYFIRVIGSGYDETRKVMVVK